MDIGLKVLTETLGSHSICLSGIQTAIHVLHQSLGEALQAGSGQYQGDAMILFMWQDDIIGAARVIDACLERVYTSAGPPVGDRASYQP